jgi:hypothetical protein
MWVHVHGCDHAQEIVHGGVVALFELTRQEHEVKVVEERHYQLVPTDRLDAAAIRNYKD